MNKKKLKKKLAELEARIAALEQERPLVGVWYSAPMPEEPWITWTGKGTYTRIIPKE